MTRKDTDTHVYFYTNEFSNFHPAWINHPRNSNVSWPTSEHAFMWFKAKFFGDVKTAIKILDTNAAHPRDAKALGREVVGYNDAEWSAVRFGFMTLVNLWKYQQNPDLLKLLLDTGMKTLVEASKKDKIWGVGLYNTDPLILDERNWLGTNLLGRALMDVRDILGVSEPLDTSWLE